MQIRDHLNECCERHGEQQAHHPPQPAPEENPNRRRHRPDTHSIGNKLQITVHPRPEELFTRFSTAQCPRHNLSEVVIAGPFFTISLEPVQLSIVRIALTHVNPPLPGREFLCAITYRQVNPYRTIITLMKRDTPATPISTNVLDYPCTMSGFERESLAAEAKLKIKAVLTVRCPTCGASRGVRCRLGTGLLRKTEHRDRRLVAKENC